MQQLFAEFSTQQGQFFCPFDLLGGGFDGVQNVDAPAATRSGFISHVQDEVLQKPGVCLAARLLIGNGCRSAETMALGLGGLFQGHRQHLVMVFSFNRLDKFLNVTFYVCHFTPLFL